MAIRFEARTVIAGLIVGVVLGGALVAWRVRADDGLTPAPWRTRPIQQWAADSEGRELWVVNPFWSTGEEGCGPTKVVVDRSDDAWQIQLFSKRYRDNNPFCPAGRCISDIPASSTTLVVKPGVAFAGCGVVRTKLDPPLPPGVPIIAT